MYKSQAVGQQSVLCYRISNYGNSIVIAREIDARRVDAVNKAIKTAQTWGEFRTMLPAGEWDALLESGYMDPDEIDPDEMADPYGDAQPFNAEMLPGYSDGDYPVWLGQKMLDILPADLLEKYAEIVTTVFNGNSCFIEAGKLENILREFEERGFIVKDGSHLDFH